MRVAALAVIAAPLVVWAQAPVGIGINEEELEKDQVELGGEFAYDLIHLDAERLSIPLKYGSVRKGSETVELNGRTLRRDVDYSIDYPAGTILLRADYGRGDVLRVQYRYDESGRKGTFGAMSSGLTNKLDFTTGSSLVLGLGVTERRGSGEVISSNVYGVTNSFSSGGASLTGLMMVGEQQSTSMMNLLTGEESKKADQEGTSQAILQQFQSSFMGGTVEANYQDIGTDFAAFSSFQSAGYSEEQVNMLRAERGIKRTSFQLNELGSKGLNFSGGMRVVGDDSASVRWRNYGAEVGKVSFNWNSREVDRGAANFLKNRNGQQVREEDRDWLIREQGLERSNFSANYDIANVVDAEGNVLDNRGLSWNQTTVMNDDGSGFYRRSFQGGIPYADFSYSAQRIDEGFTRFGDLREDDRKQLSQERGLARETLSFSTDVFGSLSFSQNELNDSESGFEAQELDFQVGRLSLSHTRLEVEQDFRRLGNLNGNEIGRYVDATLDMYGDGIGAHRHDPNDWVQGNGLVREGMELDYDFGQGMSAEASRVNLSGQEEGAWQQSFKFNGPKYNFSYLEQNVDDGFNDGWSGLMRTEQQLLGNIQGLDRTELDFSMFIDANKNFKYESVSMSEPGGDLDFQSMSYADKGFNLDYNRRSVDDQFSIHNLPQASKDDFLVSEAFSSRGIEGTRPGEFKSILGFDQTEVKAEWQMFPTLNLAARSVESESLMSGEESSFFRSDLRWEIDKLTSVNFHQKDYEFSSDEEFLVDETYRNVTLNRNLGDLGQLMLREETADFEGTFDDDLNYVRQTLRYSVDLNDTASFETLQSETRYDNGSRESTASNTVSARITERTGVSVTDTQVRRPGEEEDLTSREYGFWIDFGEGIRFNYGYARDLHGENFGTLKKQTSLETGGGADVQGVTIESAQYGHERIDGRKEHHTGQVSLKTTEPISIFGLLNGVEFGLASNTDRHNGDWRHENQNLWIGGQVGQVDLRYQYQSQVGDSDYRAIDRRFVVDTDLEDEDPIRAEIDYNVRTLPWNDQVMTRRFALVAEPWDGIELVHRLETNPLKQKRNVLLGTIPEDQRYNKWALAFTGNENTQAALEWEEWIHENRDELIRSAAVDVTLFAGYSPLSLKYGLAQREHNDFRTTQHIWGIAYTQQAGPNQTLSMELNNMHWQHNVPDNRESNRWNLQFEYSLRF